MKKRRKVWLQFRNDSPVSMYPKAQYIYLPAVETGRQFLWLRQITYRIGSQNSVISYCKRGWVSKSRLSHRHQ